ncbi:MAG TPA: hypothetical protein VFQ02_11975 [Nitrospira sp.]|nr:hypothetical protein [Nitrospira sp.]
MHTRHRTIFHPALGLVLAALLTACGTENNGQTVTVNLSLIVNSRQAQQAPASRLFAWIERWFPGATPAWAQQAVTDIASLQVQITGPGIPAPATTTVPVSDPTSGQEIPVSIQAPVGPNRTITVVAFNAANQKIFGGTLPGVTLAAGAPINLEINLVRLFTVVVQKHPEGTGDGTVTSSPVGVNCGSTCSGEFEEGTTVSLNASPAAGSAFAGWSGGGCSGTGACSVANAATVTARFDAAISTNLLGVAKTGNGSGTVTSTPSGISCGAVCSSQFPTGSTVVLEAAPDSGSTLSWSGAGCSGSGACVVVMIGDQTVTANFVAAAPPPPVTLTVTVSGAGTVTSNPGGISCPGTCSAGFAPGTNVVLTATPGAGSSFSGDCTGTSSCSIVMDANRTVTATFSPPVTLTVTKMGSGTGTVMSSPTGIDCGGTCVASFPLNSPVTLTASPDSGFTFTGWSGGGCSGTGQCSTVMSGDQTVVATFEPIPPVTLTVTKDGQGNGTVTSNPPGIDCGGTCTATFPRNTVVTLTASPEILSVFDDWSGSGCNGNGPCTITMDGDKTVEAEFDLIFNLD